MHRNRNRNRLRTFTASLLSGLILAGCGSGDGVPRVPLAGKVTFDGAPLDKGTIAFVSTVDDQATAGGVIEGGAYAIPREDGLPPGTYRVSVWANRPTGRRIKDRENPGTTVEEVRQVVPDRYNRQTQLTAEVTADASAGFDFDLAGSAPNTKLAASSRR